MTGKLPDNLVACVGGGSNALGLFTAFLDDESVVMHGVEPAGRSLDAGEKCSYHDTRQSRCNAWLQIIYAPR